jgi:hypothetical protein
MKTDDPGQLPVHIDTVKRELVAARKVIDAKEIHDKASAMEHFAKTANDKEMLIYAREVKIRAKRRAGELIRELKAEGQIKHEGDRKGRSRSDQPTLKKAGVTKQFASEAGLRQFDPADSRVY